MDGMLCHLHVVLANTVHLSASDNGLTFTMGFAEHAVAWGRQGSTWDELVKQSKDVWTAVERDAQPIGQRPSATASTQT